MSIVLGLFFLSLWCAPFYFFGFTGGIITALLMVFLLIIADQIESALYHAEITVHTEQKVLERDGDK